MDAGLSELRSQLASLQSRCPECGRFARYPQDFVVDECCAACYDVEHPEVGDYGAVLPGTRPVTR